MAITTTVGEFISARPDVNPTIYAYKLPGVPSHNGYLKVGFTDRDANIRIREDLHTSGLSEEYQLVFERTAVRHDGTCFTDHDLHKVLRDRGFLQYNYGSDSNEWYKCTVEDVISAYLKVRDGFSVEHGRTADFKMRPEQYRAIEKTITFYRSSKKNDPDITPKFLWNAKMRFGKTFATYQLAKKMGLKRILVLTFKPAVESAWATDIKTHVDFQGWQFISNKDASISGESIDEMYAKADTTKPIVVFGSFQDLLGTNESGGIKAKNEFIHSDNWDLVVFDEYHFGAWRETVSKLFEDPDEERDAEFDPEKYKKEEADNAYNESFLPITTQYYLFLSGTPFRAINSGEFIEDQIFSWTYSDEQRAKAEWKGANNPYEALPRMVMFTYTMPESITRIAMQGEFDEFDLNVFFSAKGKGKEAEFVYKSEVQHWLDLIRGSYAPSTLDNLKLGQDKRPPMPFADATLRRELSHVVWFMPNVASCQAMANLLAESQNNFYNSNYKVVVCAGTQAGIGLNALPPVQAAMDDPLQSKTITLTCGKLTTGVTIRPWSGIFMLRNLKSPETYFQAAFRVQSPWEVKDEKNKNRILKKDCYVFDFALNRALRQISDYASQLNPHQPNPEKSVEEFIHFLPVLAYDGSTMKEVNAQDILDITTAGTSATLLARRWQSALLVNVDNDTLRKLMASKEAMDALMSIEGFRSLNEDITTIINKSEHVKDTKKKKQITSAEKRELTQEEKEFKTKRKEIQEKLIKFATRIPIFMYLTDYRERTLQDVITQLEPGLFKKVTGLNVTDFDLLCKLGVFNSTLMNDAIFKFKRYEDASLSYSGIEKQAGDEVGGWDTTIRREEYERLFFNQQETMKGDSVVRGVPRKETVSVSSSGVKTKILQGPKKEEKSSTDLSGLEIGRKVSHKTFGEGTITRIDKRNSYVFVRFSNGEKQFILSKAFAEGFLILSE